MDKKAAKLQIMVSRSRRRAFGPKDDFVWFVDAPVGWVFAIDGLHRFTCDSERDAQTAAMQYADSLEQCDCGCAEEEDDNG